MILMMLMSTEMLTMLTRTRKLTKKGSWKPLITQKHMIPLMMTQMRLANMGPRKGLEDEKS